MGEGEGQFVLSGEPGGQTNRAEEHPLGRSGQSAPAHRGPHSEGCPTSKQGHGLGHCGGSSAVLDIQAESRPVSPGLLLGVLPRLTAVATPAHPPHRHRGGCDFPGAGDLGADFQTDPASSTALVLCQ